MTQQSRAEQSTITTIFVIIILHSCKKKTFGVKVVQIRTFKKSSLHVSCKLEDEKNLKILNQLYTKAPNVAVYMKGKLIVSKMQVLSAIKSQFTWFTHTHKTFSLTNSLLAYIHKDKVHSWPWKQQLRQKKTSFQGPFSSYSGSCEVWIYFPGQDLSCCINKWRWLLV